MLFLSQGKAKDFASLDCEINGSDITFYERFPMFFTWILSPYSPHFKGAALVFVLYFALCCLLHTISPFLLLLFNCDFTSLVPPSSLLGFFYLIRRIWWFAGAGLLWGNRQEGNLLLFDCVFTTSGGVLLLDNDPVSPRLQSMVNYKLPAVCGLLFNCLQFVEV